ncbi:hypothetical protein VE00_11015 [Pseudogymnoascus sp. WSF 3629]|nr:hypothetical protein VE00_11015 [Pseudogymnoascus sp. WSF 3629]
MKPIPELDEAIAWQAENPTTTVRATATIHNINLNTLQSRLQRAKKAKHNRTRGGHNRILSDSQMVSIQLYIRNMYESGLRATNSMVFNVIQHLKETEQPPKKAPSKRWFQQFLHDNQDLFKVVKTKRIARDRVSTQDIEDVSRWFDDYTKMVKELDCGRDDILNFDEAGFRIGMS